MNEYVTEGVVLSVRNGREADRSADIFTRKLGRVDVKIIGGRKPLSKLAPHLDVLSRVKLRLIEKNQFTVVDALGLGSFPALEATAAKGRALAILHLLRQLVPKAAPDPELWHYLVQSFRSGSWRAADVLRILGYAPEAAVCGHCGRRPVAGFHLRGHEFFCERCLSKAPPNEMVYL